MTNTVVATLKGALNSSIDIMVNTVCHVGQKISFEDMGKIAPPQLENYTHFFYKCIDFCTINGSRIFNIDHILRKDNGYELEVSPVEVKKLE